MNGLFATEVPGSEIHKGFRLKGTPDCLELEAAFKASIIQGKPQSLPTLGEPGWLYWVDLTYEVPDNKVYYQYMVGGRA